MGDISSMFTMKAPIFTAGLGLIDYAVFSAYLSGMVGPEFIVFAAVIIMLITSLVTAAYVALCTIDASVSFSTGFARLYRNSTMLGNGLGLWELIFVLAFLTWSLGVTYMSFMHASHVVDQLNEREYAVYNEGTFGHVVDPVTAGKQSVLLMILAFATWTAGHSLADNADELLNWFDHYADDTKTEGDTKQTSVLDEDGTSILYDLVYHSTTLVYAYTLFTTIIMGGYWFAMNYMKFKPVENCDMGNVNTAKYSNIVGDFKNLNQGTYDQCITVMKGVSKTIDLNEDGFIDRCENAKFLKAIGNSEEYALNYSSSGSLLELQEYCKVVVIDAFDTLKDEQEDDLLQTIISFASGCWPFNLLAGKDDHLIDLSVGGSGKKDMDDKDGDEE
jgi:hypothetical protein